MRRPYILPILLVLAGFAFSAAQAEDAGQADLDKATEAKLAADSPDDLAEVIRLCQSALAAGLDDANTQFANKLLVGTLVQRAEMACGAIFDRPNPPAQWPQLRQMALGDLDAALDIDADQADAHFMVGRLQALPGGDSQKALKALNAAIRLSDREPAAKAKALVLRANLTEKVDRRQADYDEAVKLAPTNPDVRRSRGLFYLVQNKLDEALADLDEALALDPKHADTHEAKGVALFLQRKYDEALKSFDTAIELAPKSALAYTHRARLYAIQGDTAKAMADIEKAVKLDRRSPTVYLLRARLYQQEGKRDEALADVEEALKLQPGSIEGLQLHAALTAGAGKFAEAIQDLEQLKEVAPDNAELLLQLGMFYAADKKPQKAVDIYAGIIEKDAQNWLALRSRADAYLSLGKQAEAITDYDAALKLKPEDSSILNNLAWVLATSLDDKLRDGKRSIELATTACTVTKYKAAHILSTLAASYAESGDFDNAVKWSKQAVELGKPQLKEQLGKELSSYEAKKPWREEKTPDDVIVDSEPTDDEPDSADDSPQADTSKPNESQ